MRIDRFDMIAYGHFTSKSLHLHSQPKDLHFIYGDNEAGKSTSLRALTGWLFGIPRRCQDDFLHDSKSLRIGGQLRLKNGQVLEFIRKKGLKKTLLDFHQHTPLDDHVLSPFLPAGMDTTVFQRLWGISYEGLVEGGKELLEDSGDVGQALYSAAIGTAGIQKLLLQLKRSMREIFLPTGSKPLLNVSIAKYRELRSSIKESSTNVSEWRRLEERLQELDALVMQKESEIQHHQAQLCRYQRVHSIKEPLALYRSLIAQLQEMEHVILLPEDFTPIYHATLKDHTKAQSQKARYEDRHQQLQDQITSLHIRTDVLAKKEEIAGIRDDVVAIKKALRDIPKLEAKSEDLRTEAQEICEHRLQCPLDQLREWRPLVVKKSTLHELVKQDGIRKGKLKDLKEEELEMAQELQDATDKLKTLACSRSFNFAEMRAVVRSVQKLGDMEQQLQDLQLQYDGEWRQCEDELQRLGGYEGSLESVLRLSLPSHDNIQIVQKASDAITQDLLHTERNIQELQTKKSALQRSLHHLTQSQNIPTREALEQARQKRETYWQALKQQWPSSVDKALDIEKNRKREDSPRLKASIATYEHQVQEVDDLADRLTAEAELVNKKITLQEEIQDVTARITEKDRHEQVLQGRQSQFLQGWQKQWRIVDVEARSPQEMSTWLTNIEALCERIQKAVALRDSMASIRQRCEASKKAVAKEIAKLDSTVEKRLEDMTLSASLELFESLCYQEEEKHRQQEQIEKDVAKEKRRLNSCIKKQELLQQEYERWQQEWELAVQGLPLTSRHPEQITTMIDAAESALQLQKEWQYKDKRIAEMRKDQTAFENKVQSLIRDLGFDHTLGSNTKGLLERANELTQALEQAQRDHSEMEQLHGRIEDTAEQIEKQKQIQEQAQHQFLAWQEQARVKNQQELEEAGELSRKKRQLQQQLETTREELHRHGDGKSLNELEQEYQETDVDALGSDIERLQQQVQALQSERDHLRDQRAQHESEKNRIDGSAEAAMAAEEAAAWAADITSHRDRYIRLLTASLMLKDQIEHFRKSHQGSILKHASSLFSRLTQGSFQGLSDDYQDGKPVLVGLKHGRKVETTAMSTGTRDQLFLALRLAIIDNHLQQREPMPFIVDDILMGFDDHRTQVCLEILGELSKRTQVLLFTHHHRIIEIAEKLFETSEMSCHHLGPS